MDTTSWSRPCPKTNPNLLEYPWTTTTLHFVQQRLKSESRSGPSAAEKTKRSPISAPDTAQLAYWLIKCLRIRSSSWGSAAPVASITADRICALQRNGAV